MFFYSKELITVATMLDTRTQKADGSYPVKIRVNRKRVRAYYPTGKSLTKEDWLALPSNKSHAAKALRESIENSFSLVRWNVEMLLEKGLFSFEALDSRMGMGYGDTLNNALHAKIKLLRENDQIGTMQIYMQTLRLVEDFAGNEITFDRVSVAWLQKLERHWLKTKNQTTVGMHFRNLRAIVNDARHSGMINESQYPFGKGRFEIKTGESRKLALNKSQLAKIINFSDENQSTMKYRDLWLFIYLCNGINVADMVKMKYSNIVDDEICFVRQKTEHTSKVRHEIHATLLPEMKEIIKRWGNPEGVDNYLFPFLKGDETELDRKRITKEVTKRINKRMKEIGKVIGINDISTYTARHSFATMLKRSGVSISFISESLGHRDVRTTESYLADFEKDERVKNASLLTQYLIAQ